MRRTDLTSIVVVWLAAELTGACSERRVLGDLGDDAGVGGATQVLQGGATQALGGASAQAGVASTGGTSQALQAGATQVLQGGATQALGGASAQGGVAEVLGGATAQGGATGGTSQALPATGGYQATGGTTEGTGGSKGSGGATATGGVVGSGGRSSTGGTTSGIAGTSGTSGGEPRACTSSDGSGCDDSTFCVDIQNDTCVAQVMSGCAGLCAQRRRADCSSSKPCPDGFECVPDPRASPAADPATLCVESGAASCTTDKDCPTGFLCFDDSAGRRCYPDRVNCTGAVTCPAAAPADCPSGFARSAPDGCFGPCIPIEYCGCSADGWCTAAGAYCDRNQGRCYTPKSPEPRCQLPFDPGPCTGNYRTFAFVNGECTSVAYGGCAANDNRFSTLEECLSRCQGMPAELPCPEGRVERVICLGCGTGGGCTKYSRVCAEPCQTRADCDSASLFCVAGYCEVAGCV
jgi:hypothetical protein